jgi:hypothetical protein
MTRIAAFYGLPVVTVTEPATRGLRLLGDEAFGAAPPAWPAEPVWLVTSRDELAADLDPARVRAVLASAGVRAPLGGTTSR